MIDLQVALGGMAELLAVNYNVDCLPEGKLRYAGICDFDAKDSMIHDQSFKKILSKIGKSLPSTSLQSLEITYNKHKAGKTRRDAVIKHLKSAMFMTKKILEHYLVSSEGSRK